MRILLMGESGQVGYELKRSLSPLAEVIAPTQTQLDLTMPAEQLVSAVQKVAPDLVVNAAAYTAVDKAEQEPELAYQINAHAPAAMAAACKALNIPLIHFSTDYVFNGDAQSAWTEQAEPAPLNVYGHSKLQGEKAIQNSGVAHLILRTSWVYGNRGKNFLCTMKRLAQDKELLTIVDDQHGAPTWSRHLADAVSQMVAMSIEQGVEFWNTKTGVYHLTGSGQATWYDFACAIFDTMRQSELAVPTVKPIKSEAYPTPARRPKFSVLDNSKIKAHLGIQLPDWRETLRLVMQDAGF
jgi:dTDP-4-dehydrorhamnose reductase